MRFRIRPEYNLPRYNFKERLFLFSALVCIIFFLISGCTPNNPYRSEESGENFFYTTFTEEPKTLDPARSYSSDQYALIGQIYEPPVQYHYLKRPYTLIPLTTESVPEVAYLDEFGKRLPQDVSPDKVHRAVYEIRIKRGIMFQEHPAFAKGDNGEPLYVGITERDLKEIWEIKDFPVTGTRELTSDDYIFQIMRLSDPQLHCPILPILEKYILGLEGFSEALKRDLEEIRKKRKKRAGAAYSQALDERKDPIILDYRKHPLPGVEKVDDYTFRIILKKKYPQFVYWLAMPFFSPVPEEVVRFYKQGPLQERNVTIGRFPVGTGPYRMETYNPNMEMVLIKNENYHLEEYPVTGDPADRETGLLEDAGKELPFIEKIIFKLEKEDIPRWNKFLQGYYDNSGITSDSFDQAVTFSVEGRAELTDFIKKKDIRLITSVRPSTFYTGFNMLDEVVGGLSEERQKLRQAISIALDYEEFIEIFANGRGIPAMSPLPPGIFGYEKEKAGINPFVYDWDETRKRPVRKSIEEAKKLLTEAGYPGGRDRDGKPLVITFDNAWTGPENTPMINWFRKRFKLLGIQLENRTTDYNRFQDKMLKGNFQFFFWGWNADYPDPENFFFLLYGPNGKVKHTGENAANYENTGFDRLFRKMENMDNTPERMAIIKDMNRILQEDAPWVWGYHPVAFALSHGWVGNLKSNAMANNTMKYINIEAGVREELRYTWNRPDLRPLVVLAIIFIAGSLPAFLTVIKRLRGGGR
jgi:ABC-type transport system substrate-binding protein